MRGFSCRASSTSIPAATLDPRTRSATRRPVADGRFVEAARASDEQSAFWRTSPCVVGRRTGAARSKERLGRGGRAFSHANLVLGAARTSTRAGRRRLSDLVAVPTPAAPETGPAESDIPLARRASHAVRLPRPRGRRGELEGTLDPIFSARVAAGPATTGARVLLRRRYPSSGRPRKARPAEARRAFYPSRMPRSSRPRPRAPACPHRSSSSHPAGERLHGRRRSRAGALGLMQVMPATGRTLYSPRKRREGSPRSEDPPRTSGSGDLLRDPLAQFQGDTAAAVAAYNAGPGA